MVVSAPQGPEPTDTRALAGSWWEEALLSPGLGWGYLCAAAHLGAVCQDPQTTPLPSPAPFPGDEECSELNGLLFSYSVVSDSVTPWTHLSSVHGILQVRTLEWVAYPFSWGSS